MSYAARHATGAKAEKVGDTLCDVKAEALVNTLAKTPLKAKVEIFGDTMGHMKATTLTRWLTPYKARKPRETSTEYAM